MNDDIGVRMDQLFGHAHLYILDPRNAPIYAMTSGGTCVGGPIPSSESPPASLNLWSA
jgi:hypothetical protein